jgi:amino acid transporter
MSSDRAPEHQSGLHNNAISGVRVFAQSLAYLAPSAGMAIAPAIVASICGNGAWLTYVLATAAMLVVAYLIARFAARIRTSGSLYTYGAQGLGPTGGYLTGWALLLAYWVGCGIVVATAGIYFGAFLSEFGISGNAASVQIPIYLVLSAGAALLVLKGVEISTLVSLWMEVITVLLILVVLVLTVVHTGTFVDTAQLHVHGSSATAIGLGLLIAITGLAGFESSATLGFEAKNPARAIPRAMYRSVLVTGALLALATYVQVLGFHSAAGLAQSSSPLNGLASRAGVGWLSYAIDLGVTASAFASIVAGVNAGSRLVFTMGREGVFAYGLGAVHPKFRTPHRALALGIPAVVLPSVIMVWHGTQPVSAATYLALFASLAAILAYAIVCLALPAFLKRHRALNATSAILAPAACAMMVYILIKTVYPAPPSPENVIPYIFVALICAGIAWFAILRFAAPARAQAVGTFKEPADVVPEPIAPAQPHDTAAVPTERTFLPERG